MRTVCLITPGHIASNPRLVKEAMALSAEGYSVHIVFTQYLPSLIQDDYEILNQNPDWKYSITDWTSRSFSSALLRRHSALKQKSAALIFRFFSGNYLLAAHVLNRHLSRQQKQAVKTKADFYIAHNLGALAVAVFAAKKTRSKSGFDAEDFHRYESHADVHLKSLLEEAYIPQTDFFSASSPHIAEAYSNLFPQIAPVVVRNVFPKTSPKKDFIPTLPLKLFWFSQTVGLDRGIEQIIQAMHICGKKNIELHLLGSVLQPVKNSLQNEAEKFNLNDNLFFYNAVSLNKLFELAGKFHIGMASETGTPLNRELCLTNKLFTYIQCGMAVIASETTAQKAFFSEYPDAGKTYAKNSAEELSKALLFYFNHPEELWKTCEKNAGLGQTLLNWENESAIFLMNIKRLIPLR